MHAFSNIPSPLQNVVKLLYKLQVFVPVHGSVFMVCDLESVLQKNPWYNWAVANVILIWDYT